MLLTTRWKTKGLLGMWLSREVQGGPSWRQKCRLELHSWISRRKP